MRSFLTLLLALAAWCAGGAPIGAGGLRAEAAPHPGYAARKVARSKKSARRKATRRTTRAKATRARTTRAKVNRKARRGSSRRATKRRTTRRKAVVTQRRAGRGARRGTPRRASARRATKRTVTRATAKRTRRATAKRGAVNRRTAAKRTVGKRTAAAKRAAAAKRKTSPKVVVTLRKPTAPRGADVASQAAAAAIAPSVGGTPGSVEPELLLVTARAMEEGRIVTRRPWNCVPDRLKAVLGQIAERWGPVTVNSTHRSRRHNRRVGGRPRSYHLRCKAVDFRVNAPTPGMVAWLKRHPLVGGYKRYRSGYYHIDTGPRRTW